MPEVNITVNINDSLFIRDPINTNLGKKIIKHGIILINEIGIEELTFRKLAFAMNSTEASIYRYFENKYNLLAYLTSWYWDFMHFMVLLDLRSINDPKTKLNQAIITLVNSLDGEMTPPYIDHSKLHLVVVENASKVYHHKNVDTLNKEGYYINYKKIIKTLSKLIIDIDKDFKYPIAFAANLIEQSLNNEYYILHLPSLTDTGNKVKNAKEETIKMLTYMVSKVLD